MAQPDDLIGLQINNFVIRRHLARGGMADVYLAENVGLQREVVLKILLPSLTGNVALVERFRREAQSMARLQHPNIVQVYDTGDTPDGRPFIAMQYIRGGTLEGLLDELEHQQQVMTPAFALAIARQMAAALAVAHAAGIIHRDLKPSNILLDEQRRPLLTDLGIAFVQDTQRLTRTDVFIGTPHYMSPEQGKGLPLDARSDIYSLGVVLFEMLAGRRPFPGDSHWALIHAHTSVPAPALADVRPGLPRAVNQLVARCLEKDPARRYQTAAELAAALDRALGEEGAPGTLTASGEWQWRPRSSSEFFVERAGRLQPLMAAGPKAFQPKFLGGLVALIILLAGGFWLVTRDPVSPSPTVAPTQPTSTVTVEITHQVTEVTPEPDTSTPAPIVDQTATDEAPATVSTEEIPPSATITPTVAPAPTTPAAPGQVLAQVAIDAWTYEGPGMTFPIGGSLRRNEEVEVLGRDIRSDWYLVLTSTGGTTWISARFIEATSGTLATIDPAATIPVPPTPTPTSTPTETATPIPPTFDSSGNGGNNNVTPTVTPGLP